MGKYIYKITNNVNGLCYIGQSIDPQRRFKEHCQRNEHYASLIHRAIEKYGKESFTFEILGYFENYNEVEKEMIQKYNCITPNGYNIQAGGEEPPHYQGELNSFAKISNETAEAIKRDLLDKSVLRKDIRKKYDITEDILRHINDGTSWHDESLTYPLRPCEADIIEERAEEAKRLLKETTLTHKEIAERVGLKRSFVTMINMGQNHYDSKETYPIRPKKQMSQADVDKIISLLQTTDWSYGKIGEACGCNTQTVGRINRGENWRREDLTYPIKK